MELPKAKYILTGSGFAKLKAELEELEGKRAQVVGDIRIAKSYGDLRENFDDHEAKRQQGFVEGRIMELRIVLPAAYVVKPEEIPTDQVWFGSLVSVKDLEYDDSFDFALVGPLEADPDEERISYEFPLGQALMGRRVGDVVEVEVPAGTSRYEILSLGVYEAE